MGSCTSLVTLDSSSLGLLLEPLHDWLDALSENGMISRLSWVMMVVGGGGGGGG